ncbi:MAG TPA: lipocalin-like domain-containing protein [Acidimicrobiales bacterium]|nr:lipocalin-like domain-containing protein [Acidimicrobiales bacterium]
MSAEEDQSLRERIVGTYRLLYVEQYADDGEVTRSNGDYPRGYMVYTADGITICLLMRSDRKKFAGSDLQGGTVEERAEAFSTAVSHAGTWEVVDGKIIHHLDCNTYPNWTDTHQVREFDLSATHLTLHPPKMLMNGKMRDGRVFWERVESHTGVPLAAPFGDLRGPPPVVG